MRRSTWTLLLGGEAAVLLILRLAEEKRRLQADNDLIV